MDRTPVITLTQLTRAPQRSRGPGRLLFVLLGLGLGLVLRAGLPDPDALIQKVEHRYNSVKTLSVDFSETYRIAGHLRPREEGRLTLRKQGKMRWDYTRPAGKLFVSDGKNVYLYTASDNRVEKVPLRDTQDMRAPLAFLLGRLDMKKEFRDFAVRSSGDGVWLDASAKSDRLPYEKISIELGSDGEIRELVVNGRDQSILKFSFRNERVNPAVKDEIFRFQIPPGAEVVDAVEYAGQGK